MHVLARTLAAASLPFLIIAAIFPTATSAQAVNGVIRGEVTDTSGGVLPGVTVVASSADGRIRGTTVTNDVGRFVIATLPAGAITLTFELDGFDTGIVGLAVQPGIELQVVERLKLARVTEEVVVYGKAPVDPPPPPPPSVPYVPPPRPTVIPVPAEELQSVCGPAKPGALAESFGTIRSHRYDYGRTLYTNGDWLAIDGGTLNGLAVGRNLVVRRHYRTNPAAQLPEMGEHTAGLVQIVAADERSSTAVVVYACNELMKGDRLEAFAPEPVPARDPAGTPAYDHAARILFADDGQLLGVPGRLMVIDRGLEHGIIAGQRLTVFRRRGDDDKPLVVGEAVVVSARIGSATVRVVSATDAIEFGDWAAPQRPSPTAAPVAKGGGGSRN